MREQVRDMREPGSRTTGTTGLQNRDPARWRDAWQLEHVVGKYVISDTPLTADEWIKQTGATLIVGEATVPLRTIFAYRSRMQLSCQHEPAFI
jgi:hypothetical protein